MKKISGKFILEQIIGIVVVGVAACTIFCFVFDLGVELPLHTQVLNSTPFFVFIVALFYVFFANSFTGRIAKKTMDKNCEKEGFADYSSFNNDEIGTIGTLIRIEEKTGRIAYVSYQNPRKFQLIPAKEITDIKSDYKKSPLGGTNYVYFEFYYKNKRLRIPTFTSKYIFGLQTEPVMEGISKADTFVDILKKAQIEGEL